MFLDQFGDPFVLGWASRSDQRSIGAAAIHTSGWKLGRQDDRKSIRIGLFEAINLGHRGFGPRGVKGFHQFANAFMLTGLSGHGHRLAERIVDDRRAGKQRREDRVGRDWASVLQWIDHRHRRFRRGELLLDFIDFFGDIVEFFGGSDRRDGLVLRVRFDLDLWGEHRG